MKSLLNLLLACCVGIALSACGGGGGGGRDGGGGGVVPVLPADATMITTSNAGPIAQSAVGSVALATALTDLRAEAGTDPTTADVMRIVIDKAFDRQHRSDAVATGVVETEFCSNGGSGTLDYTETASSASGTLTFDNCGESGLVLNGSFSFSSNWNDTSGEYSDSGNGSLTITMGSQSFTLAINFTETGNEFSDTYSTNISLSVSGNPDGNYLLTTTQNITGDFFNVNSGQLLVQGAGNTRLRITITSPGVATVELDDGSGTFVFYSTISV